MYEHEPLLRPFLEIVDAVEAPHIDYYSPEVEGIINDMRSESCGTEIPLLPEKFEVASSSMAADTGIGGSEDQPATVLESAQMRALGLPSETFPVLGDPGIEQVVGDNAFINWGKNVSFRASHTLIVRSVEAVCKVVKWAASEGRRVRVAGFRHTWR